METKDILYLIGKRGLEHSTLFYFYSNNSFYHICLLIIATLNSFFNINIIKDKKVCHCTID